MTLFFVDISILARVANILAFVYYIVFLHSVLGGSTVPDVMLQSSTAVRRIQ